MTCIIKDTSPALDAIIKLLSVLNLTNNYRTVIATKLLSNIAEPHGGACAANAIDSQTSSSLSVDAELADAKRGCMLNAYKHIYFNVPLSSDAAQPLYYVTRGHKISMFSGWGNVGPKVLGVSRAIFGRVENIDQGIEALIAAINAGTTVQV